MNNIIVIHYDFTDGSELSYIQGLNSKTAFTTHCLEFFSTENINAIVVKKNGEYIKVKDLLENTGFHTKKQIRKSHKLRKMLIANVFEWAEP